METTATRRAKKLRVKFPGAEYTFLDVDLTITREDDDFVIDIKYILESSLGVQQGKGLQLS